MSDYTSTCLEQIRRLGFKAGTQLNIFCPRCRASIKVFSDTPDETDIENFLSSHEGHGCFFGFSDGRRWEIQNDGGDGPQRKEHTIGITTPEEPLSKSKHLDKGKDAIPGPDIFEGDTIEDYTWIKLYRKLRRNPIYKDSIAVHLFVHLLLTANHKPNRFIFNEKEIRIKRGQLVTGRKQISSETGISEWAVRKRLKLFEKFGILARKTTSKFSIITICNYKHYQETNYKNSPDISPAGDGCQTSSNPPATHHKQECKNVRTKMHYVEGSEPLRLAILLLEEIRKNKSDFKEPNLQTWAGDIDLMIRHDHRSPEAIERVIKWVQSDHGDGKGSWKGWAPNILSPGKLREKFDELQMKMQAANVRKSKSSW